MNESDQKMARDLAHAAVEDRLGLPDGVHLLTEESRTILDKAHLRGQEIERRHLKRES